MLEQSGSKIKKMDENIKVKKAIVKFKKSQSVTANNIKNVQNQTITLKKQNKSLVDIVKELRETNKIDDEIESVLHKNADIGERYRIEAIKNKFFTNEFMQRYTNEYNLSEFYPHGLRKFAMALNFYSPSAYIYVRQTFDCYLPNPRALLEWYVSIDDEPGFTGIAFDLLKVKRSKLLKNMECCLVFDEMNIRQPKLCKGLKNVGHVDMGNGLVNKEKQATKAFVMMIVCLDENWKIPVAYFLVNCFSSELIASTVNICLQKCDYVGVNVRAVTFTGCARNIKAANILGCNISNTGQLKTTFPHPVTNLNVVVFMDACHMMKLVRKVLEKRKIIFNEKDQRIELKFFTQLLKLQENQRLNFKDKSTNKCIYFRNEITKAKLGIQLLSRNVANAITLCNEGLQSKYFSDSNATVEFINLLNKMIDILNSRRSHQTGYKRAMCPNNKRRIFSFIEQAVAYIKGLKICITFKRRIKHFFRQPRILLVKIKKPILDSNCKMGFLGLVVSSESLKILYENLVKFEFKLKYISTYRLSLYHLELFFKLIKKHGGINDDLDHSQFRSAYRHCFYRLSLNSSFNECGIAFDHRQALNESSVRIINNTSEMNRHEAEDEFMEQTFNTYQEEKEEVYSNNCDQLSLTLNNQTKNVLALLSESTELIVGYIAGWVARRLIQKIKCEICVSSLVSNEKLFFHKLIEFTSTDGLCFPSPDLFKVCLETEKSIKHNNGPQFMTYRDHMYLATQTLSKFIGKSTFSVLSSHSAEQPATLNHRLHLIRAIIKKYITIRMNHEYNTDDMENGQLILFKGQKTKRSIRAYEMLY